MGTDMAINAVNKDGNSKRRQLTFIFSISCSASMFVHMACSLSRFWSISINK